VYASSTEEDFRTLTFFNQNRRSSQSSWATFYINLYKWHAVNRDAHLDVNRDVHPAVNRDAHLARAFDVNRDAPLANIEAVGDGEVDQTTNKSSNV